MQPFPSPIDFLPPTAMLFRRSAFRRELLLVNFHAARLRLAQPASMADCETSAPGLQVGCRFKKGKTLRGATCLNRWHRQRGPSGFTEKPNDHEDRAAKQYP